MDICRQVQMEHCLILWLVSPRPCRNTHPQILPTDKTRATSQGAFKDPQDIPPVSGQCLLYVASFCLTLTRIWRTAQNSICPHNSKGVKMSCTIQLLAKEVHWGSRHFLRACSVVICMRYQGTCVWTRGLFLMQFSGMVLHVCQDGRIYFF